jgi:hypothetical protein
MAHWFKIQKPWKNEAQKIEFNGRKKLLDEQHYDYGSQSCICLHRHDTCILGLNMMWTSFSILTFIKINVNIFYIVMDLELYFKTSKDFFSN